MTNQVNATSPSTLVSTISPRAFGLLPTRDSAFESDLILPALFFKDRMLPFVNSPFLLAVVNISTSTRTFLVGDSGLATGGNLKGGTTSVPPSVKDEDSGFLCRGVDW